MEVYFAGTMSYYYNQNKPNLAEAWRKNARAILNGWNVKSFDPTINYNFNRNYESKGVVYQNINYLNQCDIMLVNLDKLEESQGTIFEMYYYFLNHKPVIAFGNTKIMEQPHIKESISIKFDEIYDAIDYIRYMYCQ